MPHFQRLSDLLLQYHLILQQDRSHLDADRRTGAATLALALHGARVFQTPALVNSAGLALSQERLTVHHLNASVIEQVQETDVRFLPSEPPRLLRSGWVIETSDLARPLFADVVCLGGYAIDDKAWVMGLRYPDGVFVGQWRPRWGDSDIEGAFYETLPDLIDDTEAHRALTLEGIEFAITLGALLDAEGTPLEERAERIQTGQPKRKPAPRNPNPYAWSVRRVFLKPPPVPAEPAQTSEPGGETAPRVGLHPEARTIRGYLRRQAFGPGRSERKWVYVASFEATRYVGTKPVRIRVEGGEEPTQ